MDCGVKTIRMKDLLGTKINIGDIIVYPVRKGSWMEMKFACVTGFDNSRIRAFVKAGEYSDRDFVNVKITSLNRVIVLGIRQYNDKCDVLRTEFMNRYYPT